MMDEALIDDMARALREAASARRPIAPLRERLGATNLEDAYAVQQANTRHALAGGRRLVGRKIGLTARAVQQQLGVDQPDFGALFADMAYGDGEPVPLARLIQPKVEAEVALVMARDLDRPDATMADVIGAVAYALPALEIVDSRIAAWDIKLSDTVADNASSGLFVLGGAPKVLTQLDLADCRMALACDGEPRSSGTGAACLGHPLNAAVWLARVLARRGDPLRAGDVVLTGALGPMAAVTKPGAFEAAISGLGTVRCTFE